LIERRYVFALVFCFASSRAVSFFLFSFLFLLLSIHHPFFYDSDAGWCVKSVIAYTLRIHFFFSFLFFFEISNTVDSFLRLRLVLLLCRGGEERAGRRRGRCVESAAAAGGTYRWFWGCGGLMKRVLVCGFGSFEICGCVQTTGAGSSIRICSMYRRHPVCVAHTPRVRCRTGSQVWKLL
jgi:hypothetical protein